MLVMQRIVRLLLLCPPLIALSACSAGGTTATTDSGQANKTQATVQAQQTAPAAFKPITFKGCGNRVLPPIELPVDAVLKWTNPDGEMTNVGGEAVDPESSAGLANVLSVSPQKVDRAGDEFVEAGTYKGVEVSMYVQSACWSLRFTPYE
ncbi:MAG: hypothetical protein JWM86_2862 [Thermoleophilia bacterium]|nr:hypothetical protein [Thermoleophilia bacterium]